MGNPVAQSKSPLIHNAALKANGLSGSYYAFEIPQKSFAFVGQLLSMPGFRGMNVTIPHKSRIIDILDSTDPLALEVGAVNTIAALRNGFAGYNTDVHGFVETLRNSALLIAGRPAVILGSGGAARAAVASLRELKADHAVVVSRKPVDTARSWPSAINRVRIRFDSYASLPSLLREAGLVINTTPVGMFPKTHASPIDAGTAQFLKGIVCMDAIYNPFQTQFLKQAEFAKAKATLNGLPMFVHQAAASFRIWTGKRFPVAEATELLEVELKNNI